MAGTGRVPQHRDTPCDRKDEQDCVVVAVVHDQQREDRDPGQHQQLAIELAAAHEGDERERRDRDRDQCDGIGGQAGDADRLQQVLQVHQRDAIVVQRAWVVDPARPRQERKVVHPRGIPGRPRPPSAVPRRRSRRVGWRPRPLPSPNAGARRDRPGMAGRSGPSRRSPGRRRRLPRSAQPERSRSIAATMAAVVRMAT